MTKEILLDRVIVITGGAGLLGRAFANEVAQQGGIAIIADIDEEAASNIASIVSLGVGGRAEGIHMDITDRQSVVNLIERLNNTYGRIDAVINNAYPRNTNYGRLLEQVEYKDFCENINLHLGGYFLVTQQFCLEFKKRQKGNVINLASVYGFLPPRFQIYNNTDMTMPVEYAAIKSAVIQLTKYFAQYYKNCGIRVNSISPGGVLDGQSELFLSAYKKFCSSKGMLDPSDLTGAITFLLSDMSSFINGQNLCIDDGFSL